MKPRYQPDFAPSVQMETETRSRLGFLRRGGRVAVSAELMSANEDPDDENTLFGLEKVIDEYLVLRNAHEDVIQDFVTDEDTYAIFGNLITRQRGQSNNRDNRRNIIKIQEKDFQDFAGIYVTAGKVSAAAKDYIDNGRILNSTGNFLTTHNRIDAKRNGILSNLPVTPEVTAFHGSLVELEGRSKASYKPVVKKEDEFYSTIYGRIHDQPKDSLKLVDAFTAADDSDTEAEKGFASLLANDYRVLGDASLLAEALQNVDLAAKSGGLALRFIGEQVAANNGDNILAFFASALAEAGTTEPLAPYMARKYESWPSDLQTDYAAFASKNVDARTLLVKRSSEKAAKRAWLRPDLDAYEDAVDRLFIRIHGKFADNTYQKPKGGPAPSRFRTTPQDYVAQEPGKRTERDKRIPLNVATLVNISGGLTVKGSPDVDSILGELLSRDQRIDSAYIAELNSIIERLRTDPFGRGVTSLATLGMRDVDGERKKMYRANPARMGIPSSKRTKDSRIVFTVTDRLAILAIPKNHQDYEQIISHR